MERVPSRKPRSVVTKAGGDILWFLWCAVGHTNHVVCTVGGHYPELCVPEMDCWGHFRGWPPRVVLCTSIRNFTVAGHLLCNVVSSLIIVSWTFKFIRIVILK